MKLKSLLIVTLIALPVISFADMTSTSDNSNKHAYKSSDTRKHPSDTSITAKVKAAFLKEKVFGHSDVSSFTISVETTSGVVHLTGTADNDMQITNAVKLAKKVKGVTKVVSDVTIKNSDKH